MLLKILPSGTSIDLDQPNPEKDLHTISDARHVLHLLELKLQAMSRNGLIQCYLATQKNVIATEAVIERLADQDNHILLSDVVESVLPDQYRDDVINEFNRRKNIDARQVSETGMAT
ncbi:MAG: hypothetical protein DSY80_06330 [Desulfocapsa sp.]|nr:MAG: hypothetical protein DSY80_06330 [Desulfocapsa sp.]